jgi:hypothetical protein
MRNTIVILSFICFAVTSCNDSKPKTDEHNETPKALEDKSSSYEIISKRGYGDLIESLYKELADKNPELNELEMQIKHLAESKGDSAASFNNYDNKNKTYYASAGNHLAQLKDTLLKQKIKQLIEGSTSRYNRSVTPHNDLLKAIDSKHTTLHDLHVVLKITRTLPLIEKYQEDAFPSTHGLNRYAGALDKTIRYADTLTKK